MATARLLQRKRRLKIELCVRLSLLRLSGYVGQFVRTFACLARMAFVLRQRMRAGVVVRASPQYLTSPFGSLRQKIAPKGVLYVHFI